MGNRSKKLNTIIHFQILGELLEGSSIGTVTYDQERDFRKLGERLDDEIMAFQRNEVGNGQYRRALEAELFAGANAVHWPKKGQIHAVSKDLNPFRLDA